ncbi:hypothetical protein IEE91_07510 [Kocuria sp. cx-455]|uniref:hypothetical protein n=1 Tax=Kocuria sp. cx-455 TaxID=2771377 RepID=UPI001683BAA3|nr:hypothetical protein [Kocuria sp. cx-455]MBD2765033.1 hypothetical protein [Kocuria sp. cx-455]
MNDTERVLVGRESTPEPPGLGSSTLGEVLKLDELDEYTGRRGLVVLSNNDGRSALRNHGFKVFPAVPGLINQSLHDLRPGALVLDAKALDRGPWAGTLTEAASELLAELDGAVSTARELELPVYWLGAVPEEPEHPLTAVMEHALVVTPGSELYEGTVEGAPPSCLVRVLRTMVG